MIFELGEGCTMRKSARVLSVIAVVLVTAGLMTAAAPARSVPRAPRGFWAVTATGQSFADSARQAARSSASQVAATITGMIKRVEAGHTVLVPEGNGSDVRMVPATVAELRAALAAIGQAGSRPDTAPAGKLPMIDPHEFRIRGKGCHPVTWNRSRWWASWCQMPFQIDGQYCDPEGCTTTDVLTTRLLVDPGAKVSRVSRTSLYKYQAHQRHFTDIHIEWWTLCFRKEDVCGNRNTDPFEGNSSGTFNPTSSRVLRNSRIRHGFTLWAFFVPEGKWQPDDAKTWLGYCKPASARSNQCLYPA
jgi:hypothetical protein